MRRWRVVSGMALLAVAGAVASVAAAHQSPRVTTASSRGGDAAVVALGKDYWEPNGFVAATFRWSPGTITVHSGDTLSIKNTTTDPHTFTLAKSPKEFPHSFESRCKPCEIASKHLKNPQSENSPIAHYVLNAGKPGLDIEGDSVAVPPKGPHKTAEIVISAPPGATLYFLCAIHPWMQGVIKVTS